MMKKLTSVVSSVILAVALVPAPAFAASEAGASANAANDATGVVAGVAPVASDAGPSLAAAGFEAFLQAQALMADYSWYDPNATSYTLKTVGQLFGFANLVNGADGKEATTFEGKTVTLQAGTYNFLGNEWTPIGDATHPFLGSFCGSGATVDNFKVTTAQRAAYLGFFGYVGTGGAVDSLTVGSNASVSITRTASSADAIHHVAGVVGYCGGTITSCRNAAPITVTSAVVQTSAQPQVVTCVGGVAGECVFDMSYCSNSAAITVNATSDPVGSVGESALMHFLGGVVGILGDSTRVGTSEKAVPADPALHGSMSYCVNTGKLTANTPSQAGTDRFGKPTSARSVCVGGIAGYSQGSVRHCTNGRIDGSLGSDIGYVRAEHATSVGGIVGSLRGLIGSDNPTGRSSKDDGMASTAADHDAIEMSDCINYGDVYGLNAVGGMSGHAGTYTTIVGCVNSNKANGASWVVATRWNKPAPAGIVGSTSGDVAFCANFAQVASGSWDNEKNRTIVTASGYYAAGIAGMLSYYSQVNSKTQATEILSPIPEVYGCYNAGSILAVSGMRQRGIVGENEGHVHDCALLKGSVENDKIAYGDDPGDSEASGTVANCKAYTSDELKGVAPISLMNASAGSSDWSRGFFWTTSTGVGAAGHYGYPVLSTSPAAPATSTDISGGTAVCKANAKYNGGTDGNEAVPTVELRVNGVALTAGVDYYVVPESGAVDISAGQTYMATVRGIGSYYGSISNVAYGIDKGRLSECSLTVKGATFNFNVQYPKISDVTVKTQYGVAIDSGEFEIVNLKDSKGNVTTTPTNRGNYTLTLRVKPGSEHFDASNGNTASGTYRISPADIVQSIDFTKVTISYKGQTYPWVSSSDEQDVDHPKTTLPYSGEAVNPKVSSITYNGHKLVENVDYRIVYGNPNSGEGDTSSHDLYNMGKRYGTSVGCVTVRFVTNSNFSNYANMFFNITDSRKAPSAVTMYRLYNPNSGEHFYTGNAKERDDVARAGWTYEGVGWTAPSSSWNPVYRVYNAYGGDHHYTTSASERDSLVAAGWKDEGIGWYSDEAQGVPLYRQYNPNQFSCNHNYTTSKKENDWLVSLGWKYEGISWYGLAT